MSARDVIASVAENKQFQIGVQKADAILSALDAAGFAVVPVEPTNSMELAASEHDMNEIEVMRKIWRAMLSASEGEL